MIDWLVGWSEEVLVPLGPIITLVTAVAWGRVVVRMLRLRPRRTDERAFAFVAVTLVWLFAWLLLPPIHWPPTDLLLGLALLGGAVWMDGALYRSAAKTRRENLAETLRRRGQ